MEDVLELIITSTYLSMLDKESKARIKIHKPISEILEFKRAQKDIIILRIDANGDWPLGKSNIYCLNDSLEPIWDAELPFDKDIYPNPIEWDKEINTKSTGWYDYVKDNVTTFTTSSQRGVTVTIDYNTGKIVNSEFTK
jgi:hypothetical protein